MHLITIAAALASNPEEGTYHQGEAAHTLQKRLSPLSLRENFLEARPGKASSTKTAANLP